MSELGQIVTKEAIGQIYPINVKGFPVRLLPPGLHIMPYSAFYNELRKGKGRAVYHRHSQDQDLLDKVAMLFERWSGRKSDATFTPTDMLIATWENYTHDRGWTDQVNNVKLKH